MKKACIFLLFFFSLSLYGERLIDNSAHTIEGRFLVPKGYKRCVVEAESFADYLRKLPLKDSAALVRYYDGRVKVNRNVYEAVVDLKIGKKNLHQCADAIIRLRAEYFWKKHMYDNIAFHFTNGFLVKYSEWMKGRRIVVKGNKSYWNNRYAPSNQYADLWNYLEVIFSYAGTRSLAKELKAVAVEDMHIGDVFIVGGSPGHAVIVVDMAENKYKQKIFMLAQSYMPAQEIQILSNPMNAHNSPWYALDFGDTLYTPEWSFSKDSLKRF